MGIQPIEMKCRFGPGQVQDRFGQVWGFVWNMFRVLFGKNLGLVWNNFEYLFGASLGFFGSSLDFCLGQV